MALNVCDTNHELMVEQCIDILHQSELTCILMSISESGYPYATFIKPLCGLGIDTIYFTIDNDAVFVRNFNCNTKGSITYYSKENSVHLIGDVLVISAENLCQNITDTHLFSTIVPSGSVLLKFATHKACIHTGEEEYIMQM